MERADGERTLVFQVDLDPVRSYIRSYTRESPSTTEPDAAYVTAIPRMLEALDSLGAKEAFDDHSMRGRDKIFEVRRVYNDVNFIDEFLTEEFVARHHMYRYRQDPASGEIRVVSRDWEQVKRELLARLANMGQPYMYLVDANFRNRGELYLAHQWNGLDLDIKKAEGVLKNLRVIWGRPVHCQARIDDQQILFTCDDADEAPTRQKINEETPKPAHVIE